MKGKNLLLIVGAGAVAFAAYYVFFKKPQTGKKEEKKSNATGTAKTVGPCGGSMFNPPGNICEDACEKKMGGTYNSSNRTCSYVPSGQMSPLFNGSGIRVITGKKIVTV